MSLTIPRAGVEGGRAAAPQFEAPQIGAAVADLGEVILQVAPRIENDRLEREFARAQVDFTRDLGAVRLKYEQSGDPDAIDSGFSQDVQTLRDEYAARLSEKNRERFGLAFDDLSNRHAFALGGRSHQLRQSQALATWGDLRDTTLTQAAAVDADTQTALLAAFDAQTDKLVESGAMTPEAGAEEKRRFRADTANTRAIGLVASDPDTFIADADAGAFAALGPEAVARYRVQAEAAKAAAAAAAAKDAEAAAKLRSTEIGAKLTAITTIAGDGRVAVDEVWLADPEVKAHPDYPKAMAAVALRGERVNLPLMTVRELDQAIEEERAKPVGQPYQTERLKILEDRRAAAATGWAKDPVAFARESGLSVPDLPDFDPSDPAAFRAGLAARIAFTRYLKERGYTDHAPALDLNETERLKAVISKTQDPAQRAHLAQDLAETIGAEDPDLMAVISGDKAFLHTGALLAAGGHAELASEIMRGQQAIDAGTAILPPVKNRTARVFTSLEGVFADVPGGEAVQAQIVAAADALYAARVRRPDPTGAIDGDAYAQALHEVMGGTGTYDSDRATGGVAQFRDRMTPLPTGTSRRSVDTTFGLIADDVLDLKKPSRGPIGELAEDNARRSLDAVASAALTGPTDNRLARALEAAAPGKRPLIAGQPLTARDWKTAQLVAVGPDDYQLVWPRQSGVVTAVAEDGTPWQFSLTALIRGYGQ